MVTGVAAAGGVHRVVEVVVPLSAGGGGVAGAGRGIALGRGRGAGPVVDMGQLHLQPVEPLPKISGNSRQWGFIRAVNRTSQYCRLGSPVVDGYSDGEAEDEHGDDHAHEAARPAPLPRHRRVRGQGQRGVRHPQRHRAVGAWARRYGEVVIEREKRNNNNWAT